MSKLLSTLFMAVAITSVCLPTTSKADTDMTAHTGNELITACNDTNSRNTAGADWNWCVAYVSGIENGLEYEWFLWKYTTPSLNQLYCLPANATRNQFALVVSKYLHDHPEQLNEPDIALVLAAYENAWPCPKPAK